MRPGRSGVVIASFSLPLGVGCHSPPDGGDVLEITIPPYEVPLGAEMVRCHEMALPSDSDVDVVQISSSFSEGSHHVHVYVAAGGETGAEERTYDCEDAVNYDDWHLLVAAQTGGIDWTLPDGVAIRVKARQSLLVQTHWLNIGASGQEATTAKGSVRLGLASPGSVTERAAAIVGQNLDIDVPPHSSGRAEGECALPGEGQILAMMGHHHQHGTNFRAWVQEAGQEPGVVYESDGLPEPPWLTYDALHLGEGARFGWSCDYDNNLDVPLVTGPLAATQEHCALFAYYRPSEGDAEFVPCVMGPK